jgi:hypothetical protein
MTPIGDIVRVDERVIPMPSFKPKEPQREPEAPSRAPEREPGPREPQRVSSIK